MNKLLLGTTAIVGASLLMAGSAYAAKPTVTVSGYFDFMFGGSSHDTDTVGSSNTPGRGFAFRTDSEFHIKAKGKTDAGMKWSLKMEHEGEAGSIDESVLSFSGSWGQINLGNEDGAEDLMQHGKPYGGAGDGGIDGDWIKFIDWNGFQSRFADSPKMFLDTSDANKVTYFTPRINGLQAGLSFTPDTGSSGQSLGNDIGGVEGDSDFEESFGFGVNFKKKFGAVAIAVSGVGHIAEAESVSLTADTLEDARAWAVGAEVAYGGWVAGGTYSDSGDGGELKSNTFDDDNTLWSFGVGYSQGPVTLGVSYLHVEVETAGGDDEGDAVAVSATYSLGGGARVWTDLIYFDTDDASDSTNDNNGFGFILGASVKF